MRRKDREITDLEKIVGIMQACQTVSVAFGGGALVWTRVLARVAEAALLDHGQHIDSYVASEHGLLDGLIIDLGRRTLETCNERPTEH